jgi:predicted ATPase
MISSFQHNFIFTELDPDLLSKPFGISTNWHVVTGAPCSGKTTLIDQLATKGFRTVPETARLYFDKEMAKGRTIEELRENCFTLERGLIDMQLKFEGELPVSEVVFLDRGIPDSLTYCRVAGVDPNEFLSECFFYRYAAVFVLDRIAIQQDNCRIEDDVIADLIDEWLARDYAALGYNIVRVPVMLPRERLAFVLENLTKPGLM